jgi:hypothetical protein
MIATEGTEEPINWYSIAPVVAVPLAILPSPHARLYQLRVDIFSDDFPLPDLARPHKANPHPSASPSFVRCNTVLTLLSEIT